MSFKKGDRVPLENGLEVEITSDGPFASGGQGEVYLVDYQGKTMVLKWYIPSRIEKFRDNLRKYLRENSKMDDVPPAFLWPQEVTKEYEGSFGYIMELIPKNYSKLSDILLGYHLGVDGNRRAVREPVAFTRLEPMISAALRIVQAFRDLQRMGMCYQDLNDGGFYIDTSTGEVLVCDCDNIAPDGESTGILGKANYMAPELVRGAKDKNGKLITPSRETDKYSLAVILFKFLMRGDPLDGKKVQSMVVLTPSVEKDLYGVHPVFMFDPNDDSNKPVYGIHDQVVRKWKSYPKYVRDMFIQTFTVGLMDPSKRVIPNEWYKTMSRLRDDVFACVCGR